MSTVLASCLLRCLGSLPPARVLEELTWGAEELPQTEQVEALLHVVRALAPEREKEPPGPHGQTTESEGLDGGRGSQGHVGNPRGEVNATCPIAVDPDLASAVDKLVLSSCLPALCRIQTEHAWSWTEPLPQGDCEVVARRQTQKRLLHLLCRLLARCLRLCGDASGELVVARCVSDIHAHNDEKASGWAPRGDAGVPLGGSGGTAGDGGGVETLDVHVAVELLCYVVRSLGPRAVSGATVRVVSRALAVSEEALATRALSRLVPALLAAQRDREAAAGLLRTLWGDLAEKRLDDTARSPSSVSRALLFLCTMSDCVLPTSDPQGERSPKAAQGGGEDQATAPDARPQGLVDLRTSAAFWRTLQDGLRHAVPLSRKRAVFLLKRAVDVSESLSRDVTCSDDDDRDGVPVFWWSVEAAPALLPVWESYILVLETLEENQLHVVKPVLPRLRALVEATVAPGAGPPRAALASSWLCVVLGRVFDSENKMVLREGVKLCLSLDVTRRPSLGQPFLEFICGPLMDALLDINLYQRCAGQPIGSCPAIGCLLETFLPCCAAALPVQRRGAFLLQALSGIVHRHWSTVPLLFLSQALAAVPACPAWGPEGLLVLREVVRCVLTTQQVLLRGAAQCFLLQAAVRLTDSSRVSLGDVLALLACVREDEALGRGTSLWAQVCEWLRVNDSEFAPCDVGAAPPTASATALNRFTLHSIRTFLKVPADEAGGAGALLPDPQESHRVALTILLAADADAGAPPRSDCSRPGEAEPLAEFLVPLTDTLRRLGSYAYLPRAKADRSLLLLLALLRKTEPRGGAEHAGSGAGKGYPLVSPNKDKDPPLSPLWCRIILTMLTFVSIVLVFSVRCVWPSGCQRSPPLRHKCLSECVHVCVHMGILVYVCLRVCVCAADTVRSVLRDAAQACAEGLLQYLLRQLTYEMEQERDLERADLHLDVLTALVRVLGEGPPGVAPFLVDFISRLVRASLETLQGRPEEAQTAPQLLQRAVAAASLAWTCGVVAVTPDLRRGCRAALEAAARHATSTPLNQTLARPTGTLAARPEDGGAGGRGWGRVAARFIGDQWRCQYHTLSGREDPARTTLMPLLRGCLEALELLPADSALAVLRCLQPLLPQMCDDGEGGDVAEGATEEWASEARLGLCEHALQLAWKTVRDLGNDPQAFWPALGAFVRAAFAPRLLALRVDDPVAGRLAGALAQLSGDLVRMAETKLGVFNVLVTHCCQTWLPPYGGPPEGGEEASVKDACSSALNHVALLAEAVLFGPVFRKEQRVLNDANSFVEKLGEGCAANAVVACSESKDDYMVRVTALGFLHSLNPANPTQAKLSRAVLLTLLEKIVTYVLFTQGSIGRSLHTYCSPKDRSVDRYVRIVHPTIDRWIVTYTLFTQGSIGRSLLTNCSPKDRSVDRYDRAMAAGKARCFANSDQHRARNRLWQAVLLLLPSQSPDEVERVFARACAATADDNQPSVAYLLEWALVLTLNRRPHLLGDLVAALAYDPEKNKSCVCSLLSVLAHFPTVAASNSDKQDAGLRCLRAVLPWCMSHSFLVRLYALLTLGRVWGAACAPGAAERPAGPAEGELRALAPLVEVCLRGAACMPAAGNIGRNWQKLQQHFFFNTFEPLLDYSVETIFWTFPRLSELSDDEWLWVGRFEALPWRRHAWPGAPPLANPRRELEAVHDTAWVLRERGSVTQDTDGVGDGDVQKKFVSWRGGLADPDLRGASLQEQRSARLGPPGGGLLVVASLVDKSTNLGGLCRTCEILGASALVLGGRHHVSDRQFQALSVTAEQWLPILEVKPHALAAFLQEKKEDGYSIVGAEQTANSHDLTAFRFPARTLLLLGNEREGVPAGLLQQLDACVQIPQLGVVRSLNVHVSGALLVWEYARQHLLCPR
ncbi:tRNA (guanosine(18)-2'-O)-methyltransferase TARBP1 [Petromyzon marinus]|uniref:tRNA (guanosine(18)-2'-O)-methyltransferase TARBP1 n=1 Tax=Petromyzon marinus TaxID=7757 RepID=UPI003F727F0E